MNGLERSEWNGTERVGSKQLSCRHGWRFDKISLPSKERVDYKLHFVLIREVDVAKELGRCNGVVRSASSRTWGLGE